MITKKKKNMEKIIKKKKMMFLMKIQIKKMIFYIGLCIGLVYVIIKNWKQQAINLLKVKKKKKMIMKSLKKSLFHSLIIILLYLWKELMIYIMI